MAGGRSEAAGLFGRLAYARAMWTKICGLTDPENAAEVCAVPGVAAVGLNFWKKSKRFVSQRAAVEVREAVPTRVEPVGLFVNETAKTVRYVCERLDLFSVQLHGTEPPSLVKELAPLRVIRAIRVPRGQVADAVNMTLEAIGAVGNLDAVLLDAASDRGLGGTGETLDWAEVGACDRSGWPRVILAGGLTPENAAEAVRLAKPDGVDAASGVESEPGVKDAGRVRGLVEAAGGPAAGRA